MIFRPHPAGRKLPESAAAIAAIQKLLQADAEATQRAHRWGAAADKPSFAELANVADAMVADVSGVVTDFMQSLKPFAMVATGDDTDVSEPASPPAVLRTSSSGICRRLTMRSMPCWAPIRSQLSASNDASITSVAMTTENRLGPSSVTCNR